MNIVKCTVTPTDHSLLSYFSLPYDPDLDHPPPLRVDGGHSVLLPGGRLSDENLTGCEVLVEVDESVGVRNTDLGTGPDGSIASELPVEQTGIKGRDLREAKRTGGSGGRGHTPPYLSRRKQIWVEPPTTPKTSGIMSPLKLQR